VDSGELDCFKKFSKNEDPKYLKTYYPGEAFGELALLYNAPRAASIKAKTDAILFALDRECFNNIVKESAVKKREKNDAFLQKVDLLSTIDPYERSQIGDALKTLKFSKGDYIVKQVIFNLFNQ
jgi:cAMP-dependent protein kinase regulator